MADGNGNGNGRWWRKPSFSIEEILKGAGIIIGVSVPICGVLLATYMKFAPIPDKVASLEQKAGRFGDKADSIASDISAIKEQLRSVSTKVQVQSAIDQGNAIHRDQYHRIRTLEVRSGIRPGPARSDIRIYDWPRRPQWPEPTADLWEPDGGR